MPPQMTHRLGEILVEKGFITPEQLFAAIQEQKKYRQRLICAPRIVDLKKQHAQPLTTACADEILRAHRENQHCFSLHQFSLTHSNPFNLAANDADYHKNQDQD